MKVSLIQMESQSDKAANLALAERLVAEAVARDRPDMAVLPENFPLRDTDLDHRRANAEPVGRGSIFDCLKGMAVRHRIWVHGGSFCETSGSHFHNTTVVIDPEGEIRAVYRKIHMFDIVGPDGTIYRESALHTPGRDIITYDIGNIRVGCAVCYDLRFPELFVELARRGAHLIVLPASFSLMTGMDHWETLLRTRAIDTQCFVAAAGQTGKMADGSRPTYGNSLIVDPWGTVIARASNGIGTVGGFLDFTYQQDVRTRIPVADHRKLLGRVGIEDT